MTVVLVRGPVGEAGSIPIRVDTDAPLLPNHTERRASLGLARLGATSDLMFFLTANPNAAKAARRHGNAAEGVTGADCQEVPALPSTITWHPNRRRESQPG